MIMNRKLYWPDYVYINFYPKNDNTERFNLKVEIDARKNQPDRFIGEGGCGINLKLNWHQEDPDYKFRRPINLGDLRFIK